jgi:hypothetical protein
MTTADQKIEEIDVVAFKKPIGKWPAGTTGTVVCDEGDCMTIEIVGARGETLGLPDVRVADLELVEKYS